ncbi:hypothetical protein NFI96_009280 [Prochilodus magdalenae]|nr:hypothetical protein NFI96_009280 [Prochilodus magdalenae]
MERTAITLLCDGAGPMLLKAGSENQLDRPDRGLDGLQASSGPANGKASMGGGSLPESPLCDDDFAPDFASSALVEETRGLIGAFYRGYLGHKNRNQHPALGTMSRVVEGLVRKHSIAYNGMVQKLNLKEQDDSMEFVSKVAVTLFDDGTTNWGRIVSLVGFGAVVCARLKEAGREHCVENVANHISSYLGKHQLQYLINNKAWEGFVEFFREDDSESRVRNALMAFAGFAGLGAGLALLIR